MKSIQKVFTEDEFLEYFWHEVKRCKKNAQEKHCEGKLPDHFIFYDAVLNPSEVKSIQQSKLPSNTIFYEDEARKLVKNFLKDGKHRSWINLSPYGILENKFVIEFSYNPTSWTDRVFIESWFPKEPFSLRGPSLPPDWKEGDKVKLPFIELITPEDFAQIKITMPELGS